MLAELYPKEIFLDEDSYELDVNARILHARNLAQTLFTTLENNKSLLNTTTSQFAELIQKDINQYIENAPPHVVKRLLPYKKTAAQNIARQYRDIIRSQRQNPHNSRSGQLYIMMAPEVISTAPLRLVIATAKNPQAHRSVIRKDIIKQNPHNLHALLSIIEMPLYLPKIAVSA